MGPSGRGSVTVVRVAGAGHAVAAKRARELKMMAQRWLAREPVTQLDAKPTPAPTPLTPPPTPPPPTPPARAAPTPPPTIQTISHTMVAGAFPFLLPNAKQPKNIARDSLACQAQCALLKHCRYGTFISSGSLEGECWLSAYSRGGKAARKCGFTCGTEAAMTRHLKNNTDRAHGRV